MFVILSGQYRAVGRYENPGVPLIFGGHNVPPLVEIGLTDLPKSGGTPGTLGTTPLHTALYLCEKEWWGA